MGEPVNIIDNIASHICIGQLLGLVFVVVVVEALFFAFCIIVLSLIFTEVAESQSRVVSREEAVTRLFPSATPDLLSGDLNPISHSGSTLSPGRASGPLSATTSSPLPTRRAR